MANDSILSEKRGPVGLLTINRPKTLNAIDVPTIGIGAGVGCDGQILVSYDLLGLNDTMKPRFVKRYLEAGRLIQEALSRYAQEVREGVFPGEEHSF